MLPLPHQATTATVIPSSRTFAVSILPKKNRALFIQLLSFPEFHSLYSSRTPLFPTDRIRLCHLSHPTFPFLLLFRFLFHNFSVLISACAKNVSLALSFLVSFFLFFLARFPTHTSFFFPLRVVHVQYLNLYLLLCTMISFLASCLRPSSRGLYKLDATTTSDSLATEHRPCRNVKGIQLRKERLQM